MTGSASGPTLSGRIWLLPVALLGGLALVLFLATVAIDAVRSGAGLRAFRALLEFDPEMAWNTLGNLAQMVAAILGIAITVVSIVVELAANRYTPRITDLFIRAPVNLAVLGFFMVSCLYCVWISVAVRADFIPQVSIATTVGLLTASLLLLMPYFAYVFRFLEPRRVILRLGRAATRSMRGARSGTVESVDRAKDHVVEEIEQLGEIALNAIGNRDKAITMESVRSLSDLLTEYSPIKSSMSEQWFVIRPTLVNNPDFVSMTPEVIADLRSHRLWLEMKVLRQFQTAYSEALGRQREINYMIAIHTRALAKRCLHTGDAQALELAIKFFNTYLRATVNARDVRTGYNVLHQYRLVAEAALARGRPKVAVEVARHFGYYGQAAFASGLPFLLETAAYDLCTLNKCALVSEAPASVRDALLDLFLEVDKESETVHEHEESLRKVRKAQVKLTTFYLASGQEELARRIQRDMEGEPVHRIRSIRDELDQVTSKYF